MSVIHVNKDATYVVCQIVFNPLRPNEVGETVYDEYHSIDTARRVAEHELRDVPWVIYKKKAALASKGVKL